MLGHSLVCFGDSLIWSIVRLVRLVRLASLVVHLVRLVVRLASFGFVGCSFGFIWKFIWFVWLRLDSSFSCILFVVENRINISNFVIEIINFNFDLFRILDR